MFKAIAKLNFGTIIKNISLATVLVLGLSQTAKADESKSYGDFRVSCDPAINRDSKLSCSFNNQLVESNREEVTEVAQGNRGRRRKSTVDGYYAGFSLGLISPSGGLNFDFDDIEGAEGIPGIDYDTGFSGSIFGGIKFSEIISAELEFLLGFGSGDTDGFNDGFQDTIIDPIAELADISGDFEIDSDYSIFALYASPRFDLPISNKFSVFISPGIGLAQTNVNVETTSDLNISGIDDPVIDEFNTTFAGANLDADDSTTGFSFKIKAGAEYSITNNIDVFGQASYVTLPVDEERGGGGVLII